MQTPKDFPTQPNNSKSDAHSHMLDKARALHQQNQLSRAKEVYEDILRLDSRHPDALHLMGVVSFQTGDFVEAERYFSLAIKAKPDDASIHSNYGLYLYHLKRLKESLESFDKTISIHPNDAEAFNNRGNVLMDMKRLDEALENFDRAISIRPNYARAFYNRGVALKELNRLEEALVSYDNAVAFNPDYAEAFVNRGNLLKELRRHEEALQSFDRAISIQPDFAEALINQGNVLKDLKRFTEAMQSYDAAIKSKKNFFDAQSNRLFMINYMDDHPAALRLDLARQFGINAAQNVKHKFQSWRINHRSGKLKIGFLSGDFRSHPVGFFLINVLSHFDRTRFEICAYTTNSVEDKKTLIFKALFDSYKSLVGLSDEEAANLIHADGVQILIDLSGHTALNRLPVFAYKPAPVQASWLGYFASTGVKEIDYLIGDPYVTPPHEESHFCEIIKRLPETYFCFTPPDVDVQVKTLPAVNNGFITFGCFNNFTKVNETVISLWTRILLSVEGSKIFMKTGQLKDPAVVAETIALFAKYGAPAERLLFEGESSLKEYFESYNKVDIALDPFPFRGGTTSAQALWMGVPVLTIKGNRFISHNGETIAHNSGQGEWIAENEDDYIAKAIRFASDIPALARLRSGLRTQVLASPLFDAQRFARNFGTAILEIWEDYRQSQM